MLEHVGYDGDQRAKHCRNLPLLEAALRREPDDVYNWRHLGEVRLGLGDEAGGEAAIRRAIELARARQPPHEVGRIAYAELLSLLAARDDDAIAVAEEAVALYPHDWQLRWLRARAAARAGRHDAALADLDRLVAVRLGELSDLAAYDRGIFGAAAQELRGLCLFRLGRYAESAAAYGSAAQELPGEQGLRAKRDLARALAGRR